MTLKLAEMSFEKSRPSVPYGLSFVGAVLLLTCHCHCIRIGEKMVELSSLVLPTVSLYHLIIIWRRVDDILEEFQNILLQSDLSAL